MENKNKIYVIIAGIFILIGLAIAGLFMATKSVSAPIAPMPSAPSGQMPPRIPKAGPNAAPPAPPSPGPNNSGAPIAPPLPGK